MHGMLAWDDLRYFLAVYRHGTHAAAGRALRVAATTIGRRLGALETELGVKLLRRTPGGLVPTEAGERLRAHAERVEAEVLASERELTGEDQRVAGPVRLTSGDGLAVYVLTPRLLELRAKHPDLEVELRADPRVLDLSRREADVAVRAFRPREPSLLARRLVPFPFRVYGSEPYFARRGRPSSLRDLSQHDWVVPDAAQESSPHEVWRRRNASGGRIVVRTSATTLLMTACAEGHGLAMVPELLAAREPRLVPVLPRATGLPTGELWAVTHPDLRHSARVNAVLEWLVRVLAPSR
ncbi:LysR family transcriptional regulator [Archangium violaceum]|uniref:LysR family transcriptional regulator n=1 Tax=Archangium violaceum TaxID=83451 RepID=UPI00193C2CC2|nr:LysR family transcriptional regulator [Archangium violaceum]QRK08292.1 LysR family transcriptional regulator [Archangium violaceum]